MEPKSWLENEYGWTREQVDGFARVLQRSIDEDILESIRQNYSIRNGLGHEVGTVSVVGGVDPIAKYAVTVDAQSSVLRQAGYHAVLIS